MTTRSRQAWAQARMDAQAGNMDVLTNPDVLDQLILWRMNDPRYLTSAARMEGKAMAQKQWTIEIRADYTDPAKYDLITKFVKDAGYLLHANTSLLKEKQAPQIAVWSEDFFNGRQELELHAKEHGTIAQAVETHPDIAGTNDVEQVSDELLKAASGS